MKQKLFDYIDGISNELTDMSDKIFDNPELKFEEKFASNLLEDYLEENGFEVIRGLGSLDTAFKAVYKNGNPKHTIGLLCEYDALEMGHGCGHQMQGPSIVGAAVALKDVLSDFDINITVYGTPAEEGGGGKIIMLKEGFLKDIDVALMMHGGPATQVDIKSMAASSRTVTFYGKSSHAALKPQNGKSALDALILSFNGIEFLREHVEDDTRMHYTISEYPGPANVVPAKAIGKFSIRSYNSKYLDELVERFDDVIKGAALMTGTTYEIEEERRLEGKIPALMLNDLIMKNAELVEAPNIKPAREKTGSSDFGNVMYEIPGTCIRVAFVPDGTSSHSQEFLDNGKNENAHDAVVYGAKILSSTAFDLINDPDLLDNIKKEFDDYKSKL